MDSGRSGQVREGLDHLVLTMFLSLYSYYLCILSTVERKRSLFCVPLHLHS